MIAPIKHICSLVGRVFLISTTNSTKNWQGDYSSTNEITDYELLENYLIFEEGELAEFKKNKDDNYYTYFAMSNKIELFSINNGFILCDGLYFNNSWDYSDKILFSPISKSSKEIIVEGGSLNIFDAALNGNSVLESISSKEIENDKISIPLVDGNYEITKVETILNQNNEEVLLRGFMCKSTNNKKID